MPLPNATVDFLKVTHYFSTPTRPVLSIQTYWSAAPSPSGVTDLTIVTVADDMHTLFGIVWAPLADSVCQLTKTRATWYGIADDGYHDGWSTGAALDGGITHPLAGSSDVGESDALPDWDALLIRRSTGKRQRQHRGRLFIPCIAEDVNKGGVLQNEHYSTANDLAAFLSTDQMAGPTSWHARHWNKKDNVLEPITQCLVNVNFTTRKDRRVRGLQLTT